MNLKSITYSLEFKLESFFSFNIKGIAKEPKPQGPFEIKPGGFATIKFKNIFEDNRTFKMFVDREDFYVKTMFETVKSKKVNGKSFNF